MRQVSSIDFYDGTLIKIMVFCDFCSLLVRLGLGFVSLIDKGEKDDGEIRMILKGERLLPYIFQSWGSSIPRFHFFFVSQDL